jgi:hypothetical protein
MRLKEARAAGVMFYTGKVCKSHPQLGGKRRSSNGNCHACICERMKRNRKGRASAQDVQGQNVRTTSEFKRREAHGDG